MFSRWVLQRVRHMVAEEKALPNILPSNLSKTEHSSHGQGSENSGHISNSWAWAAGILSLRELDKSRPRLYVPKLHRKLNDISILRRVGP